MYLSFVMRALNPSICARNCPIALLALPGVSAACRGVIGCFKEEWTNGDCPTLLHNGKTYMPHPLQYFHSNTTYKSQKTKQPVIVFLVYSFSTYIRTSKHKTIRFQTLQKNPFFDITMNYKPWCFFKNLGFHKDN